MQAVKATSWLYDARHHRKQLLPFLLHTARQSGCLDPRDRIYAVLGMTSDRAKLGIQVDHTKHSVEIVFREAAVRLIEVYEAPTVLSYIEEQHTDGLAS